MQFCLLEMLNPNCLLCFWGTGPWFSGHHVFAHRSSAVLNCAFHYHFSCVLVQNPWYWFSSVQQHNIIVILNISPYNIRIVVYFANFQLQARKIGVLGWGWGCFVYVHIPERGLWLLSKEQGLVVVFWAIGMGLRYVILVMKTKQKTKLDAIKIALPHILIAQPLSKPAAI